MPRDRQIAKKTEAGFRKRVPGPLQRAARTPRKR
jgi:hypothetical protein